MKEFVPLVICSVFKNEARYMREWLEFHILVGVEKFFMYNNCSTDDYMSVLKPYIDAGIVVLTEWPLTSPSQMSAYEDFILMVHGYNVWQKPMIPRKTWCAFIDLDEFLYSPSHPSLPFLLSNIPHACSMGVNWRCFGSGNQDSYDSRPVIERFNMRPEVYKPNDHIKSIVRLDQRVYLGQDPHYFNCEFGTFSENGAIVPDAFTPHSSNTFCINHYVTKSKEEYLEKRGRGRADIPAAEDIFDWTMYDELNENLIEDNQIKKFLQQLQRRLLN
jgi:hypothetical protein